MPLRSSFMAQPPNSKAMERGESSVGQRVKRRCGSPCVRHEPVPAVRARSNAGGGSRRQLARCCSAVDMKQKKVVPAVQVATAKAATGACREGRQAKTQKSVATSGTSHAACE